MLAAAVAGPGTVKELAARACVGRLAARKTCSRLLGRGSLVEVDKRPPDGPGRPPMVLALASRGPDAPAVELAAALSGWHAQRVELAAQTPLPV